MARAAEPREVQGGGLIVPVVLLTEGSFVDALGTEFSEDASTLAATMQSTLTYMAQGGDVPVFASPHYFDGGYKDKDIIGQLTQELRVETFTEDNLPDPRMTDLLGKSGLFGEVLLVDPDAIATYQTRREAGMSTKISVATDGPDGSFTGGVPGAIFEVSQVPWGAVPAARMLSRPGVTAALTMDGAISEATGGDYMADEAIFDLAYTLSEVLQRIAATTDEELMGRNRDDLRVRAIDDYVTMLRDRLGVATRQPPPGVMAADPNSLGGPMATNETPQDQPIDMQALLDRIAALESEKESEAERNAQLAAELAEMKALQTTADLVAEQRQRAEALVASRQLPRAQFKMLFPEGETVGQVAARFTKPVEGNKYSGPTGLVRLEAYLDAAAESAPIAAGGTVAASAGLGENPAMDNSAQNDEDAEAFVRSYRAQRPMKRPY